MDKIHVSEIHHMNLTYIFYIMYVLCNFIVHQQLGKKKTQDKGVG
jgi:hypothetical protein